MNLRFEDEILGTIAELKEKLIRFDDPEKIEAIEHSVRRIRSAIDDLGLTAFLHRLQLAEAAHKAWMAKAADQQINFFFQDESGNINTSLNMVKEVSDKLGWSYSLETHNQLFSRLKSGLVVHPEIWDAFVEVAYGPPPRGRGAIIAWRARGFKLIGSRPRKPRL